jgi:hypothetical protein
MRGRCDQDKVKQPKDIFVCDNTLNTIDSGERGSSIGVAQANLFFYGCPYPNLGGIAMMHRGIFYAKHNVVMHVWYGAFFVINMCRSTPQRWCH